MNFEISKELAQAILNYLITKPYVEVSTLIEELKKIKPIENNEKENK
jgi:hypothetical protein